MKTVIVFDVADRSVGGRGRYERMLAEVRAEIAALERQYARASAERHGRFQERLEVTRRELRETRTRLRHDIDTLTQERDGMLQRLHQQLAGACTEARGALEQRLADVQAEYRARINRLRRAWELVDSAITS